MRAIIGEMMVVLEFFGSARGKRLISALVAAALLAVCYVVCFNNSAMLYLTSDDMNIQQALSGTYLGSPYPISFINMLVSIPIAGLYALIPNVQWWFAYSHVLMGVGLFLINYSFVYASTQRNWIVRLLAVVVSVAFDAAFLVYPISKVGFTIVPGVLGAGVVSFLVSEWEVATQRRGLFCLALYLAALAHREEVGLIVLCYLLLGMGAVAVLGPEERPSVRDVARKLVVPVVVLASVTVAVVGANRLVQSVVNGFDYEAYNNARSSLVDYPHDTYAENPDLYDSVGWDENLYRLTMSWCLMDSRVNTENLNYLSAHWTKNAPTDPWHDVMAHPLAPHCMISWAFAMVIATVVLILRRKPGHVAFHALNVLGTVGVLCLQTFGGRILYRTVIVALLPSFCLCFLLVAHACRNTRGRLMMAFCASLVVGLLFCAATSVRVAFDRARITPLVRDSQTEQAIADYAMSKPNNVYIKSGGSSGGTNPWRVYAGKHPTNVLVWGGAEYGSRLSNQRFAINGLESTTGKVFLDPKVRLVFDRPLEDVASDESRSDILYAFMGWQQQRYGAIGIQQTDEVRKGVYILRVLDAPTDTPYYAFDDEGLHLVDPTYGIDDASYEDEGEWSDESGESDESAEQGY